MVAIEEMPDDGLEQPLRLDKLANEVHPLIIDSLARLCAEHVHG